MKRFGGGRQGDVNCRRCGRPLIIGNAWKLRLPNGRVDFYCAEDVIVFDEGQSWRPRTDKDSDDLPAMADKVQVAVPDHVLEQQAAQAATPEIPEETWVDRADPVLEEPETATPIADDFDPVNDVGF